MPSPSEIARLDEDAAFDPQRAVDHHNLFRRVYVAGPMSGYPEYNFPAFREATTNLRDRGYHVLSPVELDEAEGLAPSTLKDQSLSPAQYADVLARDIDKIATTGVEAIVVLPGWEASGGANTEVAFARALGLPILAYPDLVELTNLQTTAASSTAAREKGEVRITDPDTGGQKGQKDARHELIPASCLDELAKVYGFGAQKYDDFNYLQGYKWGLSIGALQRHLSEWRLGNSLDDETGLHHLAHAAWHCFALMMFEEHGLGTDNRVDEFPDQQLLAAARAAQEKIVEKLDELDAEADEEARRLADSLTTKVDYRTVAAPWTDDLLGKGM